MVYTSPRRKASAVFRSGTCIPSAPSIEPSERANQSVADLVVALAVDPDDRVIARVLDMNGTTTPAGLRWTQDRVRDYRSQQRIHAPAADVNRDTMTMNQVQTHLGVSHNGLLGLVRLGLLATDQIVAFAPWRVRREQLDAESLRRAVAELKATGRLPKGGSPIRSLVSSTQTQDLQSK